MKSSERKISQCILPFKDFTLQIIKSFFVKMKKRCQEKISPQKKAPRKGSGVGLGLGQGQSQVQSLGGFFPGRFFPRTEKTYVTENKITIRKFYRTSVVDKILVLEINIFRRIFIVYPTYLQNEFKRRKARITQTENATGLERGVSFFGVYFSKHDMQTLH